MSLEVPQGFDELLNEDIRGTITLKSFSTIFFPMFVAYFNGEQPQIGRWLTYTQTKGYEWVDVVDTLDKTTVIFSVPPILQNLSLTAGAGLEQDPNHIMDIAKIKDQTMPGAGNRHIRENITDKIDGTKDHDTGTMQYQNHWKTIFEYYGYTTEAADKKETTGTTLEYTPGDFDEYDEL